MSCPPRVPRTDTDSSDYGSDFTPDEEELLNELLSNAVAEHATVATPPSTTTTRDIPATPGIEDAAGAAEDLESLQPAALDALVADIEDGVEGLPGVRLPKVLGREIPRSPWRQTSRRSPFGSGVGGRAGTTGPWQWRPSPDADNRDSRSGM